MFSDRVQLLKMAEPLFEISAPPPYCEQKKRRGRKKREREKKRRTGTGEKKRVQGRYNVRMSVVV